jgi:Fur family transcriptional regulator, ferric uptake regulator
MARKPLISPALLILMERQDRHSWTLEDLQVRLAAQGIAADFSTIYRAAEKLVADGAARKVLLDDGRAHFELAGAHHDHLHCTGCEELIAVPCIIDRDAYVAFETATGAAVLDHRVVLTGLCPKCAAAAAQAAP